MGEAPVTAHEPVTLLLLRYLFPGWTITRDEHGVWRAVGRAAVSVDDVDGLLALPDLADPDGARRAVAVLGEGARQGWK